MFASSSSSIPAAMFTASPRAQLHMMHVQDRLHISPPPKPRAAPSMSAAAALSPSHRESTSENDVRSLNNTNPCPVDVASGARLRPAYATRIVNPEDRRTASPDLVHRNRHHGVYSRGCRQRPRSPRRSSNVSLHRVRLCSNSPQSRRQSSQGYNVVTLFGFTRDRAPVRRHSTARLSTRAAEQRQKALIQPEQSAASTHPSREDSTLIHHMADVAVARAGAESLAQEEISFSNTSPSQNALVVAGATGSVKATRDTVLSAPSISSSSMSHVGIMGTNPSALLPDSSRIVVSEMSVAVENSFQVMLSDPSVTMAVSDADAEEEEE